MAATTATGGGAAMRAASPVASPQSPASPRKPVGAWEHDAVPQVFAGRRRTTQDAANRITINVVALLLTFSLSHAEWFTTFLTSAQPWIPFDVKLLHYAVYSFMALFAINAVSAGVSFLTSRHAVAPASTAPAAVQKLLGMPVSVRDPATKVAPPSAPAASSATPAVAPSAATSPRSPITIPATPSAILLGAGSPYSSHVSMSASSMASPLACAYLHSMIFPSDPPLSPTPSRDFYSRSHAAGPTSPMTPSRHMMSPSGPVSPTPLSPLSAPGSASYGSSFNAARSMGPTSPPGGALHGASFNAGAGMGPTSPYGSSGFSSYSMFSPAGPDLIRYQRATPDPQRQQAPVLNAEIGIADQAQALQKLAELGISDSIDQWSDNLREWLSMRVFKPLLQRIDENDKAMTAIGRTDFRFRNIAPPAAQGPAPDRKLYEKYERIVPYLRYPIGAQPTCPIDYMVQRVKELGWSDGSLLSFQGDRGGRFNDAEWTADYPTDAELVMHIFCCYMDENMPALEDPATYTLRQGQPVVGRAFSRQYLLTKASEATAEASYVNRAVHLRQVSQKPSKYCVVVDKKMWPVTPDRRNVFHALVLFLLHIKNENLPIGSLDLSSPPVDLLRVISY